MPNWEAFYRNTKEAPPSPLLLKALAFVERRGHALDLGAGQLKDTKRLLELGFDVTAVDQEEAVRTMAADLGAEKLHVEISGFDRFEFRPGAYDLISAMYALPFNPPETFEPMFARLKASLAPGGVFCGQFFGRRDQWSGNARMTFHAREDVARLFDGLETLLIDEREWDGKTAGGVPKHWHVFDAIARKAIKAKGR